MTSRVNRGGPDAQFPGQLTSIVISCDQMNCDKTVDDTDIHKGGGLKRMGWTVLPLGGAMRHYCPIHTR